MNEPERPSRLSLPPAGALRREAAALGVRAVRRGRPRERFLSLQRSRLARAALPTFGLVSAITALLAAGEMAFGEGSRTAVVALASTALAAAAAAVAALLLRARFGALLAAVLGGAALSELGWAVAIRTSGGAASPYALVLPLLMATLVGILPISVRAAFVLGAGACVALVLSAAWAPAPVLLVVAAAVGAVWVAHERTRRALASFLRVERLAAALARLRRLQEQLVVVEKLEALRVLVGGMAHELNNALAVSVASTAQALKHTPETLPEVRAALGRSEGGLGRIRKTVDRLRRFAMASEGVLEPADVAAMLDFALESAIGRARSGLVVERDYDAKLGSVECHVAALAEALFQVARNAVDAMPGGGTLRASVRGEGDSVILEVADQGRGFPEEELARMFDPFHSKQGTRGGFGLSQVYGLVAALGGRVDVRSQVGQGTRVRIVMPMRRRA
jgi:signal transduction histidine kinase